MKLHEQVKAMAKTSGEIEQSIAGYLDYLDGPKFHGVDSRDGMENDYIRTWEVMGMLKDIRHQIQISLE